MLLQIWRISRTSQTWLKAGRPASTSSADRSASRREVSREMTRPPFEANLRFLREIDGAHLEQAHGDLLRRLIRGKHLGHRRLARVRRGTLRDKNSEGAQRWLWRGDRLSPRYEA